MLHIASPEQPAILFLVCFSVEAEIYFQFNVYLGLNGNAKDVGWDRKSIVGKQVLSSISFKDPDRNWFRAGRTDLTKWLLMILLSTLLMAIN